jgi:predicted transposase/invertase (TIGR01784 family)
MNQNADHKPALMQPKIDFAFKLIFGDEKHKDITIAFLSDVLKIPRQELVDIEFINTELLREFQEDKKGILDIRVKLRDKRQINVEIQILPTRFMPQRSLFYWSKMYVSQIKAGDTYSQIKKCTTINILDFKTTPLDKLHSCFHLKEDQTGWQLTDVLEVHFLELPKLYDSDVVYDEDDPVAQWMLFISGKSREVMEMLAAKNIDIGNAFNVLEIMSREENKRMAYEARQAELMDQRTRMMEAREEGWEEGVVEGQAKLLARQLTRRFGTLPDSVYQCLKAAASEQIEQWGERIFEVQTLDELLEG